MKNKYIKYWRYFWYSLLVWTAIVSAVQRFKNPKLTETELFYEIPNNVILKFK